MRSVRQLADYCKSSPDKITETQLREWLLHLKIEKQFAYGSLLWRPPLAQFPKSKRLRNGGPGKQKNLGSEKVGFFGVLHSWGRDLRTYHPHVHFVVPGGGVSPDGSRWLQVRADQLFHPRPAMMLYKKLLVAAIRDGLERRSEHRARGCLISSASSRRNEKRIRIRALV